MYTTLKVQLSSNKWGLRGAVTVPSSEVSTSRLITVTLAQTYMLDDGLQTQESYNANLES